MISLGLDMIDNCVTLIYVAVRTGRQTDSGRQTDRQRDKEREREAGGRWEIQTEKRADRHTYRQTDCRITTARPPPSHDNCANDATHSCNLWRL